MKKYIKILIILLIIITSLLIINNVNNKNIYKDTNFLLGNWIYNEKEGYFSFQENNSYIEYQTNNKENNYCQGKYEYTYSITKDNQTIYQDKTYYYYTLYLRIDYCYINDEYRYNYNEELYYLAINKKDKEDIFLMDINNNIIKLSKKI